MWKAIFLILIAYSCTQAADYQSFKKEWKFEGNPILKYGQSIATTDNSFVYAVCTHEKSQTEMNCNVTISTPVELWNNSRSHKHNCELQLTASKYKKLQYEIAKIDSVERFDNDKVIIVWWERDPNSQYQIHNIKVSILNMHKCNITHLNFSIDVEGHFLLSNVVIYENTFDVIIANKTLCGTPTCRISYDNQGNQIETPAPFITNFANVYIQPVMKTSAVKGFYVSGADMRSWKFKAMHVNTKGIGTNLITASVSDPRQVQKATSNSHEMYGICLMGNKKIHCAKFDDKANVKMNATVNRIGVVHWMSVYNLIDDGLLLLTGHCNNNKCRNFKITKVFANNRKEDSLDVSELHLKCSDVQQKFSVDTLEIDDNYCFYFACSYLSQTTEASVRSSVKFSSKCIPKRELKL